MPVVVVTCEMQTTRVRGVRAAAMEARRDSTVEPRMGIEKYSREKKPRRA
jgi:hypothetical protein